MVVAEEEAAIQPAPAVEAVVAVVVVPAEEVGVAADRAGVARVVNSVKADLRAAALEAASVFVVEKVFEVENGFAVETMARGAVTAAVSGTEGGTHTA